MRISRDTNAQVQCTGQKSQVGSKKFVQQGRSHYCAWSVLAIREHQVCEPEGPEKWRERR